MTTSTFTRKTLDINGKKMAFIDVGYGPAILFGHSFLWDADMWQPQITALKQDYRCIVPDLWSHGQSASLTEPSYSLAQLANDYQALIDQLRIDDYIIIGLSVGGMWGTHLAFNDPRVRALVIMDTYVGPEPEAKKQKYYGMIDAVGAAGKFDEIIDEIAPYFFDAHIEQTNPQLMQHLKQRFINFLPAHIPGIVTLSRTIFDRTSILTQLKNIHQPTLVVVGEGDIPRPPTEAKEMVELIPNAQLVTLKNAGHISNLEQPEAVTKALAQFLASTDIAVSY